MSNIPFNAIASILVSPSVERQTAAAPARATRETIRLKKQLDQKNQAHAHQVEDLDDTTIEALGDEPDGQGGGQQRRHFQQHGEVEELLDISQLPAPSAGAPIPATPPATPPHPTLDISA